MFVRLAGVSFSYRDSVNLLSGLDFAFFPGWTGVTGANGAGKTTLLRLIGGELEPSAGHVHVEPRGARISACPQTAERLTPAIEEFARATGGQARRLLGELFLTPADLTRWPSLSLGERRRWQIGATLAGEPAVLLLDEPTDHLDSEARELLLAGLSRFRGVGIVVSHDRALLDSLTTHTVRVDRGAARLWRGSYAIARQSWEAEEREYQKAHDRLRDERKKLRRRLADKRRMAATAQARKRRDNRARGLFDGQVGAPARTVAARTRQDISVLRRSVARVEGELDEFSFHKTSGRALFLDYVPAPVPRLLSLQAAELRAGDTLVLREVNVALMREDRVHLKGPNGAGKTTLMRAMLARAQVNPARLLYLPQEITDAEAAALLDSIRALRADERNRVLTLGAALGVDVERVLQSFAPSPGEARKLTLAWGLSRQVWALVLDEPTNHLDMPAIERLEDALAQYPGALLLVTHDEALARRCTTLEWRIVDRRVETRSKEHDPRFS